MRLALFLNSVRRELQATGAAGIALVVLFLGVMTNRYRFEGLPLRPHTEHFALGIGLLVLAWLVLKKRASLDLRWSDALLAVYLALALASSFLFPADPRASVQYWTRMISSVAVYWVARGLIAGGGAESAVKLSLKVLLAWGVLEALLGIAAWFLYPLGIHLGVDEYPLGVRGPGGILCNFSLTMYGTLWEPNVFGGVMMTIALVASALFVSNDFIAWRKGLGAAIAILLVALGLNASRGALGTLLVGMLPVLFLVRGMRFGEKLRWMIAALALVAVVTIPSLELSRVLMQLPTAPGLAQRAPCAEWLAQGMPRGSEPGDPEFDPATGPESGSNVVRRIFEGQTLASRWVSYRNAWQDFLQRPLLGNGANSFGQKYTTTAHTPGWISNLFLMALHDTGIVGTLVLSAWFGWFAWKTARALVRPPPPAETTARAARARTMALALSIGLVALFVTYQVTTMLWFGLVWWLLAVVGASAEAYARARQGGVS
jgi:hypothetical protein